jgi:hypothetical protein
LAHVVMAHEPGCAMPAPGPEAEMSITRLLSPSMRAGSRRWLVAVVLALAALALTPASADALVVSVTMPDSVTVGQAGVTAQVALTNDAAQLTGTICNAGECTGPSDGILFVPSCGAASPGGTCTVPDLGVFPLNATATVPVGGCGASPLVTGFAVVVANAAQGTVRLVPQGGSVVLGPAKSPTDTCTITMTFGVAKLPAIDGGEGPGTQTLQSASARIRLDGPGAVVETPGEGRDVTTVVPGTTQPPGPPPPIVVPPPVSPPQPPPVIQPADLDHFKCYEALQPNFRQRTVGLRDQFGQRRSRVLRTRQLCNPVSKNGGRILQPRAHLTCYETRDTGAPFTPRTVVVTNQFGVRKLEVTRPNRLCVPSLKRRTAGAVPSAPNPTKLLDHFRCYDVKPQSVPLTVKLADQFRTSETKVLRVIRLCNPVRKNNEPVRRAKSHLVCYSIADAEPFDAIGVRVRNQFGIAALRIRAAQTLCLPSFKEVVQTAAASAAPPGLDHFKCYESEQPQFQPRAVGLRDQFGQAEAKVVAARQLCNPVSKNAGKVLNKSAHLVCYETADAGIVPFKPRDVRISNQFGIRQLSAERPVALCVPSLKRKGAGAAPTGANPALVLDHFRCYDVKPQPWVRTVKTVDQFRTTKTKTLRVVRLCNPVSKNNEPVRRPKAHLVCYSIVEPTFQPLAVTVRNQFGVAGLRVRKPQMLCLPSLKKLVTAAGTEITTANPG